MTVSKAEYKKMTQKTSPGTKYGKNMLLAFLFGGAICTLGQLFRNLYMSWGLSLEQAGTFVSITLIFLSALLTALRGYDNMAKYAGAGSLVPITGFANSIVAPAMEFKQEGYVVGIGGKMFVIAGPVLVYATASSIVYGLILYFFQL